MKTFALALCVLLTACEARVQVASSPVSTATAAETKLPQVNPREVCINGIVYYQFFEDGVHTYAPKFQYHSIVAVACP